MHCLKEANGSYCVIKKMMTMSPLYLSQEKSDNQKHGTQIPTVQSGPTRSNLDACPHPLLSLYYYPLQELAVTFIF